MVRSRPKENNLTQRGSVPAPRFNGNYKIACLALFACEHEHWKLRPCVL